MKRLSIIIIFIISVNISMIIGILIQKESIPSKFKHKLKEIVFIKNIDSKEKLYTKEIDQKLVRIFGEPMQVYGKNEKYIYKTGEEKGPYDSSYRYYWHHQEIADYLVSDQAKQKALNRYKNFWSVEQENSADFFEEIKEKRQFLKETLGVKDLAPHGKVKSNDVFYKDENIVINKMLLKSRIHPISVPVYSAIPQNKEIKGVVIAVHGHSGAPEKVIGLEPRDYTRSFGERLVEEGYVVFAPYVLNISSLNTNIHALGMLYTGDTKYSVDIQKLMSVIDFIKQDNRIADLPLIVYGISYGGRVSFMLSAIDDRVDALVTSGSMKMNLEYLEDHFSLENNIYWAGEVMFNHPYYHYFRFSDLAKMIFPRPLVIELGAYDLGDNPDSIIREWENIKDFYRLYGKEQNIKLSWFKGYHETAPDLTIPFINSLVKDILK